MDALSRYRKAWAAINTLLEQGRSLSGRERNCAYLNTGGTRYADISAASGLDLIDDGRGVALVDWDHDGKVDIFTSNRTGPFLRLLHNRSVTGNRFLSVQLRGQTCNRDAIGARLELHLAGTGGATGQPAMIHRTLRAGEGFVAQSSKRILFGLGDATKIERLVIRWPGAHDAPQVIENLHVDRHYVITQGNSAAEEWEPPVAPSWPAELEQPSTTSGAVGKSRVFLATGVPLPRLNYRDMSGIEHELPRVAGAETGETGKPMLLNLWATWCPPCVAEMREWSREAEALEAADVTVLSLSVDGVDRDNGTEEDASAKVTRMLDRIGWPHEVGMANPKLIRHVDLICRSLVDKPVQMVVPTSLLLDESGRVAVIYRGPVSAAQIIDDVKRLKADEVQRLNLASHGPGRWFSEPPDTGLNALVRQLVSLEGATQAAGYLAQLEAAPSPHGDAAVHKAMLAEAHSDVAAGFRAAGNVGSAVYHYTRALRQKPSHARIRMELAMAFVSQGRHADAVPHLEAVIESNPGDLFARQQLIQSLFMSGRMDQILEHIEVIVEARPKDPVARVFRAKALRSRGRAAEAVLEYREALRLQPGWPAAMNELAWVLATSADEKVRSGKEALELAETVVLRTNRRDPTALDTLAAAYAESGDFDKATRVIEEALRLCHSTGNKALAATLETRLPRYQAQSPWREAPPRPSP